MENARALGKLLAQLREESAKQSINASTNETTSVTNNEADSKSENVEEATKSRNTNTEETKPPAHPKAVGNLLKLMQSDKDKFYEEPSERKSELRIFTPYHGPKVALGGTIDEYDDEWEPHSKKTKMTEIRDEFYCDLCDISCTSQVVLDTHLIGKKHMKNVNKLKHNTEAFKTKRNPNFLPHSGKIANIQKKFDELSEIEPIVGLEYITEYQKTNGGDHRYLCELCEFRSNASEMLEHVVTRNHRLRFMRSHFFDIYYKITNFPSFENVMKPSQADKLLRQHSSFVVRTILKGNLRFCKVRPYFGEQSMKIDKRTLRSGEIHPSQHKDLRKAEALLLEGEAIELQEQEREQRAKLEKIEMEKRAEAERIKRENIILAQQLQKIGPPDGSFTSTNPSDIQAEIHAKRLDEQERRILNALKKLQESSGGKQMTLEELNAQDKLKKLLVGIRNEKKRSLLRHIGKISSDVEAELGLDANRDDQFVPKNPREQRFIHGNDVRNINSASIVKTRREVEEKIFQALSKGSLAPLAEAFKNNPQLHAGLKQWEKGYRDVGAGSSRDSRDLPPMASQNKLVPKTSFNNKPYPPTDESECYNRSYQYEGASSRKVHESLNHDIPTFHRRLNSGLPAFKNSLVGSSSQKPSQRPNFMDEPKHGISEELDISNTELRQSHRESAGLNMPSVRGPGNTFLSRPMIRNSPKKRIGELCRNRDSEYSEMKYKNDVPSGYMEPGGRSTGLLGSRPQFSQYPIKRSIVKKPPKHALQY